MRILHCCLSSFYIDNYSYQENILPKMHQLQGHDVTILASTEIFINNSNIGYTIPGSYYTKENIPITRIPYIKWLPQSICKKLRIYSGIKRVIENFKPDIIFIHGPQFMSIRKIKNYAKANSDVIIYVDSHSDFINSGKSFLSRKILHGIIYKWCAKKIEPFTRKFYGVLPIRVDFLTQVYGVPAHKVELLVLGADHTEVDLARKDEIRKNIREGLNIKENEFVLITGGKIDVRKRIDVLMQMIIDLKKQDMVLIVFGKSSAELKDRIKKLATSNSIRFIGWIPSEKVYDYFLSADLGIFPGTHSVLWEQAVGVGLPCIFKKWNGMQHVDLHGNCLFFEKEDELGELILSLYNNRRKLLGMKEVAEEKGMHEFSYFEIAKRAIEE